MLGALQVRVVLLYGVQGDAADVARVAALQPCRKNPESLIVCCPQPWLCVSEGAEGKLCAVPEEKHLQNPFSGSKWQLESINE